MFNHCSSHCLNTHPHLPPPLPLAIQPRKHVKKSLPTSQMTWRLDSTLPFSQVSAPLVIAHAALTPTSPLPLTGIWVLLFAPACTLPHLALPLGPCLPPPYLPYPQSHGIYEMPCNVQMGQQGKDDNRTRTATGRGGGDEADGNRAGMRMVTGRGWGEGEDEDGAITTRTTTR
ncbi:unnamed protein product [Cyclocybe aegerita]|uniref:Uncharacterized protein n=1 Tax=Cyclocybe aegerita TaxID=1973307 RepID=A0A8S0XS85_CYCAE|nr:unnamed protein product [Cyclocybe aegerita]